MAFVGYPDGTLWRCRVDGTERLRLTPPSLRVYLPRWSPDGTQLAFRAETASLPVKIYTVSADGKQPQAVVYRRAERGRSKLVFGWKETGFRTHGSSVRIAAESDSYL